MENYNSGPNMQTSTSLTFFTAIFVAFSGALAEELMTFCRHVRTVLRQSYNRTVKQIPNVCQCGGLNQLLEYNG